MLWTAQSRQTIRKKAMAWLMEGVSPERLALTLTLGFVLGCIPLVGIPTWLCVVAAVVFRLNLPAMQAANYAAMPFQLALIVPFMRIGAWLTPRVAHSPLDLIAVLRAPGLLAHSSAQIAGQVGLLAGQAVLAWLLLAIPTAALLRLVLTGMLKRLPAIADMSSHDARRAR
jgi:uncharacterized protein (DUF2062 family)